MKDRIKTQRLHQILEAGDLHHVQAIFRALRKPLVDHLSRMGDMIFQAESKENSWDLRSTLLILFITGPKDGLQNLAVRALTPGNSNISEASVINSQI